LVEKLPSKSRPTELNRGDYSIFGQRATDIVGSECAIVYTNFVADVGSILCALWECGLSCAGYYGEMDCTVNVGNCHFKAIGTDETVDEIRVTLDEIQVTLESQKQKKRVKLTKQKKKTTINLWQACIQSKVLRRVS